MVGQPLLPWVKAQAKCHASSLVAEEHDAVVATRLPIGGSDTGDFPREVALEMFLFPRLAGFSDGLCLKQIIHFCFFFHNYRRLCQPLLLLTRLLPTKNIHAASDTDSLLAPFHVA